MAKKLPNNQSGKNRIFMRYKGRAKRAKVPFKLSKKDFIAITQRPCRYCKSPPSNKFESRDYYNSVTGEKKIYYLDTPFIYNGVDRKDNSKGYTKENAVPCCAVCNRAKYKQTEKEFKNWIKRLCLNTK